VPGPGKNGAGALTRFFLKVRAPREMNRKLRNNHGQVLGPEIGEPSPLEEEHPHNLKEIPELVSGR